MKEKTKKKIYILIDLYNRFRIRKSYWSLAVPLGIFIIGELAKVPKLTEPLIQMVEIAISTAQNIFYKIFLNIALFYLRWNVPWWGVLTAGIIFLIISYLRYGEIYRPVLKIFLKEKITEIKSEIKSSTFLTGFGTFNGFKGLERFNDTLGYHIPVEDLARRSFQEGIDCISNNLPVLEEVIGEMDENFQNSENTKQLVEAYLTIRNGILKNSIEGIESYLARFFKEREWKGGENFEFTGTEDGDLLSLWIKTKRIKEYI